MTKIALTVLLICAVCVNSDFNGRLNRPEYVRIKRAKYYSNPPMRFYKLPPNIYPVKGAFSYTPPPNYMEHDDSPPPGNYRPKVSRRPPNDGLEDKDINNIVKHLSKQDLDRIIEFAGEKYRDPPFERHGTSLNKITRDFSDISVYNKARDLVDIEQRFPLGRPFTSNNIAQNNDMEHTDYNKPPAFNPTRVADSSSYTGPSNDVYDSDRNKVQNGPLQIYQKSPTFERPHDLTDAPLHTEESMHNNQFSFVDSHIHRELYGGTSENPGGSTGVSSFTDSKILKEDPLPRPENLRDDQDYEVASTNNVPRVANLNSYKVESFGDLPLMDYSSKLDSVSSYHVPHYSVVSSSKNIPAAPPTPSYASRPSYSAPSSSQLVSSPSAAAIRAPKLEPAPPASAAKEQSDAHLKAIKIWTHRSAGTAYTLHDDGTLSLEKPGKPKYGP